jgi:branched-subunit amino acid aminotransferase/4-amino-4-deoxychorismate lyase
LTVSRGIDKPTTVIMTRPVPYTPDQYANGVTCITTPEIRGELAILKSLNYLPNRLGKMAAEHAGALEAIFLDKIGMVTEGTMSNVFIYESGFLRTPDLSLGILPGITRKRLLLLAKESGINYAESAVMSDAMFNADEVFITNSVAEVMPVVNIDGRNIGNGRPGLVTKSLHERYQALT